MSRIAVTGIGWVLPIGDELGQVWQAAQEGRSGIAPIQSFPVEDGPPRLGGEVREFQRKRIPAMRRRRMDRLSQLAVVAAHQALEQAGATPEDLPPERSGVVFGVGYGSLAFTDQYFQTLATEGPDQVNPSLFPYTVPNAAASLTAIQLGFKGINTTFCHKEVSSELALLYAMDALRLGRADRVLVGGGEELAPLLHRTYRKLGILSPGRSGDAEGLRPYDRYRNGMVLGEGAAVMVLEREEDAAARRAAVHGYLLVGASAGEPSAGIGHDPEGRGIERAARKALAMAGREPGEIRQVHGAADGTSSQDRAEALALARLVGEGAVPVTATRGLIGCLEGGGVIRTALAVLAVSAGVVPPVAGCQEPDPDLPVDVVLRLRPSEPGLGLVIGASHGGAAAAILVGPAGEARA